MSAAPALDRAAPGRSRLARAVEGGWSWVGARSVGFNAGATCLLVFGLLAAAGGLIAPYPPLDVGATERLVSPGSEYLFGTDNLGRDVFSRVVAGTKTSMLVGLGAAGLATAIGVVVGSIAGYREGVLDAVLMRGAEVVMIIPQFFLAVVLVVIFGASNTTMILVIGLLGWPVVARVVRAEVVSLKNRVYVNAARAMGVGGLGLVAREILPNAAGPIAVVSSAQVAYAIVLEASLGYLGVADPNQVSLGQMLQEAQSFLRSAPWMALFPALGLFAMIVSINLVADELTSTRRRQGGRTSTWLTQVGRRMGPGRG